MSNTPQDTSSTLDFLNNLSAPGRQAVALPVNEIHPDPDQPRKSLAAIDGLVDAEDQQDLELLADQIFEQGLLQPITVREMPDGDYRIVFGERRWRAVKLNNDKGRPNSAVIDAFVRQDLKGSNLKFAQLAENLQRKDLTELETATFFKAILTEFPDLQKQQLAKLLNKPNAYISRILAMLDPEWADVVDSGIITYASLLEQFKALPKETRDGLVRQAKDDGGRSLTSGDLRKARETVRKDQPAAQGNGEGKEAWPFGPPQQGGKGLTKAVVDEVAAFVEAEQRSTETYRYPGAEPGVALVPQARTISDTGGDATIPTGVAALNPALNDKRELKVSMDQLEVLLRMDCFETKGHMIATMLPVAELRNAILQLGGEVPQDDHQLVTALISRVSELND